MNNNTQTVIDVIMTRTSIRQYTDEPLTEIETHNTSTEAMKKKRNEYHIRIKKEQQN